jgi:hypothetical protein
MGPQAGLKGAGALVAEQRERASRAERLDRKDMVRCEAPVTYLGTNLHTPFSQATAELRRPDG